jgi:hypothetical protein
MVSPSTLPHDAVLDDGVLTMRERRYQYGDCQMTTAGQCQATRRDDAVVGWRRSMRSFGGRVVFINLLVDFVDILYSFDALSSHC